MKKKVNTTEFLQMLGNVANQYSWSIDNNGHIVATKPKAPQRTRTTDPISAVANTIRRKQHEKRVTSPAAASDVVGLTDKAADDIIDAMHSNSRRGYCQVLRGKIKKAVGLK